MSHDRKATPHSSESRDLASLIKRANSLSEAGRFGDAHALISTELSLDPDNSELLFARGSVLFDWGMIAEARDYFLRAERGGLVRLSLYLNLAWSCHLLGLVDESISYAGKALELVPSNADAHFAHGNILLAQKRFEEAIAAYTRVLEIAPDRANAAADIARCRLEQKDYPGAEDWFRRAIALAPKNPGHRINLAAAIINQGRYAQSLAALEAAAALELEQDTPPMSMIDTGFALVSMGRYDEALDVLRKGLAQIPDARAHGYFAFALLALGRFREGWAQYEFRWMLDPHLSRRPVFSKPQWAGQDLAGKTILLLDEQGVGDIINFGRFAVPLKETGATVILQVRPELVQLVSGFAGVDRVIARGESPPHFDYYIHLMSIPHVLGMEIDTIPATVPYLRCAAEKVEKWTARIQGSGLKVGLAWAGNPLYPRDNFRSIDFGKLARLWDVQGVRYFSLQKPLKDGELERFPTHMMLDNLAPELTDFADTAAAVDRLDLVICVDTAIAHLAGAMGKPVWLLLPEAGDYRWLVGREDSPWYPTMRLFRQRVQGEWDEVVARVKDALEDAVRVHAVAAQNSAAPSQTVSSAKPALLERTLAAEPANIARVVETRYGIIQYLPNSDHSAQSIAWYGEYLQPQLELLSRLIRPGAHVVEAGSGIGEHAMVLAKLAGVNGRMIAYESRPVIREILRQNLDANRVAANVTLMRRILAGPQKVANVPGEESSEIADSLDGLLLDRLDLLKIRESVNASEILRGASESLWRLRPIVFASVIVAEPVVDLSRQLKEFGYRCWSMETLYFSPDNFNNREKDIFDAQKAWAVLAVPEESEPPLAFDRGIEVTEN